MTSDRSKPALRKTVNVRHGFPSETPGEKARRKRCLEFFADLAQLSDAEELCAALNRIRRLPDPHYTESQWQFMHAVLEVLPLAAANLQVVFSEQAIIDFAEYAQRALDAIGQDGDPTELGLQLGYRIRHILVDEFQDTNRVQVELLARLLATWEAGRAVFHFLRRRSHAVDLCLPSGRCRHLPAGAHRRYWRASAYFDRLSQNFRSQANLVEWFNHVFPLILREESDLTNAVRMPRRNLRVRLLTERRCRSRASPMRIAPERRSIWRSAFSANSRSLRRRRATFPIAVLVRSRTHLPELVEALRAAGIAYRAVKTDRLSDRPLVRDLEALRAALTDLADRTAWLAVLRAPWCGLSWRICWNSVGEMSTPRCANSCVSAEQGFPIRRVRRWRAACRCWRMR